MLRTTWISKSIHNMQNITQTEPRFSKKSSDHTNCISWCRTAPYPTPLYYCHFFTYVMCQLNLFSRTRFLLNRQPNIAAIVLIGCFAKWFSLQPPWSMISRKWNLQRVSYVLCMRAKLQTGSFFFSSGILLEIAIVKWGFDRHAVTYSIE